MKLADLHSFKDHLIACSRAPSTIESYIRDVKKFLNYLESLKIEGIAAGAQEWNNYKQMIPNDAQNSTRRMLIAVRQYYSFLVDEKIILENPFIDVPIPSRDEKLPEAIEKEDLEKLFHILESKSHESSSLRNLSILKLLSLEGLKATEIIDLRKSAIVGERLRVGGLKARTIWLDKSTLLTIKQYLEKRSELEIESSHLFFSFQGKVGHKLSRHGLKFIIYEMGALVGLDHLNTELLRHNAINHQIDGGKNVDEIMTHFGLKRPGNIKKHILNRKKEMTLS